jgi:hypothetical protein
MVREARFAWDDDRPLPSELTRIDWDCDDPEVNPRGEPRPHSKRHGEKRASERGRRKPPSR